MLKYLAPALKTTIAITVLTGLVFPIGMTFLCQALFPFQANGSLLHDKSGRLIGSELIAQQFTSSRYFHPRPSAAGSGYAGEASGGSNLGPTSKKLLDRIAESSAQYRTENHLMPSDRIPVDAVTRSASGLDPDITPQNAMLQVGRIAAARELPEQQVADLIHAHTTPRSFGFIGEPRVNVLRLNLSLDDLNSK